MQEKQHCLTSIKGGLGYSHPVEYKVHTEYGDINTSLADELWDAIDSSPIIVALTDEYAHAHGLERSARFPWDDGKGIYHVKAFHHLHCLVSQFFPRLSPASHPLHEKYRHDIEKQDM